LVLYIYIIAERKWRYKLLAPETVSRQLEKVPRFATSNKMSTTPAENEKIALENQGQGSNAPSLSDESFTNPTGINETALVRKLDFHLLPPLTLLYLLSFLDRSNSKPAFPIIW
jgi:hypothetical protein